MKLTRIESREIYQVPKRAHYIMHLGKGTVDFFIEGREMNDDEVGDTLVQLINALNKAEGQIEELIKVISEADPDKDFLEEYLEEYPEEEDYKSKYKIEDIKDALFHAMMRKDEKLIGKYINQLNVVTEKMDKK